MSTNLSLPAQVESLLPIEVSVMLRGRMGEIGGWRRGRKSKGRVQDFGLNLQGLG
jgi:hypothetical protein